MRVLYDKNNAVLSRYKELAPREGFSPLWLFLEPGAARECAPFFDALGNVYAWTVRGEEYLSTAPAAIQEFKAGFGALSGGALPGERVVAATPYIDGRKHSFDVARIVFDEFLDLWPLSRQTRLGFFASPRPVQGDEALDYAMRYGSGAIFPPHGWTALAAGWSMEGGHIVAACASDAVVNALAASLGDAAFLDRGWYAANYVDAFGALTPLFDIARKKDGCRDARAMKNDMHDWTLDLISMNWEAGDVVLELGMLGGGAAHLLCAGVTSLVVPRRLEWGMSVHVNECGALEQTRSGYKLAMEMQTGDVLEIEAARFVCEAAGWST